MCFVVLIWKFSAHGWNREIKIFTILVSDVHRKSKFPKMLNIIKKKFHHCVVTIANFKQVQNQNKHYLTTVKILINLAKHYFWANFTIFKVFFQSKIALEPLNIFSNKLYFIKIHTISYKMMSHLSH